MGGMCGRKANNSSKVTRFEKYDTLWRTRLVNSNTNVAHSVQEPQLHTNTENLIRRSSEPIRIDLVDVFEIY